MKLLLVEDEIELSNAVKKVLEYNQYTVDTAYDGEQAIDILEKKKYDCIIMDVMMPKIDGIEVTTYLRSIGNETPIIILTAKSELDDKVTGLDAGANDYLTKPFAIRELLARIRALLRTAKTHIETGNTLSFNDLTLNPKTNELISKNKVRLTNKEYKVFELLIKSEGALISSENILDSVWEEGVESDLNSVWVYISIVRKKLEKTGSKCIIKAVRGVGYCLEYEK